MIINKTESDKKAELKFKRDLIINIITTHIILIIMFTADIDITTKNIMFWVANFFGLRSLAMVYLMDKIINFIKVRSESI